ncbi:hypothetical protein K501DRAFT_289062 [Backusella circina FSU 941]|nr:hypothetical protein K501DRAFT_289062 [Backusella circina FSU 941]
MSQKKPGAKENLTWKINYLAAQVGETTHMKTAVMAASRAKYQKIHGSDDFDQSTLKQELTEARKKKLETKLFHARKELKTALKKAKTAETQKQIKKIKNARESLEKKEEAKKPVTDEDIKKMESELDILKNINLETLAEKSLKSKLQKNATLKNEELIKDVVENIKLEKLTLSCEQSTQNIEARILSQKVVMDEFTKIISECSTIVKGNQEKVNKMREDQRKKRVDKIEKKRKAEEEAANPQKKKSHVAKGISSEFIESLGGNDWEDPEFEKIYHGEKKNRQGQRQRRKQWEEKYGRDANHIKKEYEKREEKRAANPDYRPKKKSEPKKQTGPAAAVTASEPVHPSWQAKRIQEEIMSKALSGKGTSNNKIVFED